jgi:hypothetical protein
VDFIERLFHISPDDGSGLTEWAILLALVGIGLAAAAGPFIVGFIHRLLQAADERQRAGRVRLSRSIPPV